MLVKVNSHDIPFIEFMELCVFDPYYNFNPDLYTESVEEKLSLFEEKLTKEEYSRKNLKRNIILNLVKRILI